MADVTLNNGSQTVMATPGTSMYNDYISSGFKTGASSGSMSITPPVASAPVPTSTITNGTALNFSSPAPTAPPSSLVSTAMASNTAPKATLINQAGQKVAVTSGSPEAQQYFSQGYQLMGPGGNYVPPPTQTSAVDQAITDPNGVNKYGHTMAQANDPKYWLNGKYVGYDTTAGGGATKPPTGGTSGTPTNTPQPQDGAMSASNLGDYSTDAGYKNSESALTSAQQQLTDAQRNRPSEFDIFNQQMESTGANAARGQLEAVQERYNGALADYNTTAAAFGTQLAQNEEQAIKSGVPAVFYQGEQGAMQRTQQAVLNQKATIVGALATESARIQGKYDNALQLAQMTAEYKFSDAQNKIDMLKDFVEMNRDNLSRSEKLAISKMEASATERQRVLNIAKENYTEALSQGITTKYVNRNGKFYRTSDGMPFDSEAQFFKDSGVTSFPEAYRLGLVSDITGDSIANREFVSALRAKYYLAGISLNDTEAQARAKVLASAQYKQEQAKDSGFTLSAGQTRYDASGKPIASAPGGAEGSGKFVTVNGQTYWADSSGNLSAPNVPTGQSTEQYEKSSNLVSIIDTLLNDSGLSNAVGPISSKLPIMSGARADFESKFRNFQGLLTLDNLSLLKGPMSDKDIQFIKEASSALNLNMSEAGFKAELEKIRARLQAGASAAASTNLPPPPSGSINVKERATGQFGYIPVAEFDPNKYEKVGFSGVGGDTNKLATAIGQYESGGNYKAIGPVTSSGDKAYGKYQVMGANIPSWTKEALGTSMTVQQFLNSPSAQDRVAQYKLGQYLQKYGNIADASSMWFSGRPVSRAGNSQDVLGTTVPKYIQNIQSIYNKLG